MFKTIAKISSGLLAVLMVPLFLFLPANAAAVVTVLGNTAAGENQPGWLFNRDPSTATPYEFNSDQASIGVGSLYVKPIGANAADKFIAENFAKMPVTDLASISYDFMIAGNGDSTDANQFYLNVYANFDDSNNFYSCRFDYVPLVGSTINFTTATFAVADIPVNVRARPASTVCPTTLAGMPVGSHIRAFALNVGDTSASDTGLAGYVDNVIVTTAADATVYDFEPTITIGDKQDCKNDGWMTSNSPVFKNQGDCVSSLASKKN